MAGARRIHRVKGRKKGKRKGLVVQRHHPDYAHHPNLTYTLYRGEHWIVTRLDRKFRLSKHKPFSLGFLRSLAHFIHTYGHKAVDLDKGMVD